MKLATMQSLLRDWLVTGDMEHTLHFGADSAAGLSVYLNNYRMQLLDCLEGAFPQTLAWLGEDAFFGAARQHIMACPPTSWTLDAYPETFAENMAELVPDDPVACELAQLEQALSDAFTAADVPPLTRGMFTTLDWEQVALAHAAGGRIVHHRTNAALVWSALSGSQPPPAAERLLEPACVLVWRSATTCCFRMLDPDEAQIFARLDKPLPFHAICALLATHLEQTEAGARAGLLLARWADDGAVSVVTEL
jgi:hypothetical protein